MAKKKIDPIDKNIPLSEDVDRLIETLIAEPEMLSYRVAGTTMYAQLKLDVIEQIKKKSKPAYKIINDYKKDIDKKYKALKKKSPIYMSNLEFQEKIDKKNGPLDFETRHLEFTHKYLMSYLYHAMQRIIDDIVERGEHIPERNTVMVDLNKMRESDLYAQALGEQFEKMVKKHVKKEVKLANKKTWF